MIRRSGTSRVTLGLGKVGVVIEEWEPEIEGRKEGKRQTLTERLRNLLEKRKGTPTGGLTCRWEENDGPTVDRFPRVGAVHLEQLMTRGPHWGREWNQVKKKWSEAKMESGKRAKVREGGSASRTSEDQSSTDPGGGGGPSRSKKGCPLGRRRKMMGGVANGRSGIPSIGDAEDGQKAYRIGRSR